MSLVLLGGHTPGPAVAATPKPPARRHAKSKLTIRNRGYDVEGQLAMGEFMQKPARAQAAFASARQESLQGRG